MKYTLANRIGIKNPFIVKPFHRDKTTDCLPTPYYLVTLANYHWHVTHCDHRGCRNFAGRNFRIVTGLVSPSLSASLSVTITTCTSSPSNLKSQPIELTMAEALDHGTRPIVSFVSSQTGQAFHINPNKTRFVLRFDYAWKINKKQKEKEKKSEYRFVGFVYFYHLSFVDRREKTIWYEVREELLARSKYVRCPEYLRILGETAGDENRCSNGEKVDGIPI